ncbi:DNA-binding transcriptional regulator, MerR family [Nocardia amikacinitolerans]|uniref:MerR family transcriptional regulator n=1 Tax=Nocardia amikacinitolerans TaxID=756689 RepID=UPI0020A34742|nr:MerR family transcriptional regulator [Nocardia amikacinitolerans]MCP2294605.1 DNA-binding transcriptional regulator, MerR family [Nocardia amikacinitolerans]
MTATVSIGEFARLTYLSVKTLRYYHDIELLEPVEIDPASGYRRYSTDQVAQAHLIRRLRRLDMPLPEIKSVLAAPDVAARDSALRAHLERMEAELQRTRAVVASLRSLLTEPAPITVSYRSIPAFPALAVVGFVERDGIEIWCGQSFALLYQTLAAAGVQPAGVGGATYSPEFFENDEGEVVAFVPIPTRDAIEPPEGLDVIELPARHFAIAVHSGPFEDFDRTYGALGSHVAEHDTALPEPVRELYLVAPNDTDDPTAYRTEVCWPIGGRREQE